MCFLLFFRGGGGTSLELIVSPFVASCMPSFLQVYESADSLIGDAMEALTGRLVEEVCVLISKYGFPSFFTVYLRAQMIICPHLHLRL